MSIASGIAGKDSAKVDTIVFVKNSVEPNTKMSVVSCFKSKEVYSLSQ